MLRHPKGRRGSVRQHPSQKSVLRVSFSVPDKKDTALAIALDLASYLASHAMLIADERKGRYSLTVAHSCAYSCAMDGGRALGDEPTTPKLHLPAARRFLRTGKHSTISNHCHVHIEVSLSGLRGPVALVSEQPMSNSLDSAPSGQRQRQAAGHCTSRKLHSCHGIDACTFTCNYLQLLS